MLNKRYLTFRIVKVSKVLLHSLTRPQGYKKELCSTQLSMKFQILINTKISRHSSFFSCSDKHKMLFFLLINVKMPTIIGILTIMRRKNFMLSSVEHEILFITQGQICTITEI